MISHMLRALVDQQLEQLRLVHFVPDPLFPGGSLAMQLQSSAIKRHGPLIEAAIIEALTQQDDYLIWNERNFVVPAAADHAVQSQTAADIALTRLPYGGTGRKGLQIDMMAYSRSRRRLGAYEIKRGHGRHDAGKLRSLRRDMFGLQTTLLSYGATHGVVVDDAISRVIFYYGARSIPAPWSLIGQQLDEHFGCPVRHVVEAMSAYFRTRLEAFVEGLDDLRPEIRQIAMAL